MEIVIILSLIIFLSLLIFAWIFSLDIKNTLITIIFAELLLLTITYFSIPEFALKIRIVKNTNYNQTLRDVKQELSNEEYEYYRLAILINPKENIYNHTVNHIIKLGKDASTMKISDYLN